MKAFVVLLGTLSAGLLISCANVAAKDHGHQPKQAMFKTKAEAEAAAPNFGCTGAHQMGTMWMVCDQHTTHSHD